jgi:flagellar assembly protein FliH
LSRLIDTQKIKSDKLKPFVSPTTAELDALMDERRRERERMQIVETSKKDPVGSAKKEALRILAEAQEQAKEIQKQMDGISVQKEREIRHKLEQEFQQKLEKIQSQFNDSLEELAELKDLIYKNTEAELINLVYAIVKKIVGEEVKTSPNIIMNMLTKGFENIKKATVLEIRIHSKDYDILLAHKERVRKLIDTSKTIKFVRDDSVERGGCKIITEAGDISSEPSQQLEVIIKELQHESG